MYSQPIDILNFFSILSKDVGVKSDIDFQKEWIRVNGEFSFEDKNFLKDFREIKKLYDISDEKQKFSKIFYEANSINQALTNLRKVLTQDEVTRISACISHFRDRAIKFISESNSFLGKIKELEKSLSKTKFLTTYTDAMKFFQQKSSSAPKIYFVWSTKENISISYFENIAIIAIHPHVNLYEYLDVKKLLTVVISSLFSSLNTTQEKNFNAIIAQNCSQQAIEVIKYSIGQMHYNYLTDKKIYDIYTDHFVDKKLNLHAITIFNLYESELASKKNIFGSFANKVNYLCGLIN